MRKFMNELIAIKSSLLELPAESTDEGVALFISAAFNAEEDWLCYSEPDAHTLQPQMALGAERPYSLSDVELVAPADSHRQG